MSDVMSLWVALTHRFPTNAFFLRPYTDNSMRNTFTLYLTLPHGPFSEDGKFSQSDIREGRHIAHDRIYEFCQGWLDHRRSVREKEKYHD